MQIIFCNAKLNRMKIHLSQNSVDVHWKCNHLSAAKKISSSTNQTSCAANTQFILQKVPLILVCASPFLHLFNLAFLLSSMLKPLYWEICRAQEMAAALQVQCSSSNAIKKGCTPDFRSIASRPSYGLGFDFAYRLETLTLQSPYSLSAQLQLVLIFGISFMTQSNAFCITLPISKRMPCISNREGTLFCPFSSKK